MEDDSAKLLTDRLESKRRSFRFGDVFEMSLFGIREWNKELKRSNPSLAIAMWRAFGWRYAFLGIFLLIEETVRVIQPVLLGLMVECFAKVMKTNLSTCQNEM